MTTVGQQDTSGCQFRWHLQTDGGPPVELRGEVQQVASGATVKSLAARRSVER